MTTSLYHQLGHRYNWSIRSIEEDGTGDGVILAARYMAHRDIAGLPSGLLPSAVFDPQFFVPSSSRGKLSEWSFFPNAVAGGFSTEAFDGFADETARRCLEYQLSMPFSHIVAPTRHHQGSVESYVDSQASHFIEPFLSACRGTGSGRPVIIQLILPDTMLRDAECRSAVLNWVTGVDGASGVYLIPSHQRRSKQVHDIDYLLGLLTFIADLRQNDMDVFVGFVNTEALVLLAAEPTALSMGSYENLRMFNLMAFEDEQPGKRQGPRPRVYVPGLLQWVSYEYIGAIMQQTGAQTHCFDESEYQIAMFSPTYNWHFSRPEPYRHYFSVFSRQFRRLAGLPTADRIAAIVEECDRARCLFQGLQEAGIVFEDDSSGSHLPRWMTALNLYRSQRGITK